MKIYDCFLYCDEKMLLDIRLNTLDKYVDKFVIVEANFYHNGKVKNFTFDINDYVRFKEKIIYIKVIEKPLEIRTYNDNMSDLCILISNTVCSGVVGVSTHFDCNLTSHV